MTPANSDNDRLACERLVIGSYSLMDQSRYEASAGLFAEDGVWVRGDPAPGTRGAILASLQQRPATGVTRHLISNVMVTLTGPDEAEATGNFLAFRGTRAETGPATMTGPSMVGDLFYRFRRGADGWEITHLETKSVFARAG
jgi:hypothetical protein